jgi:manganese-dependent ADP-ribose/CDP-alcohol diphosphatase
MRNDRPILSFGIVADLQFCDAPPFKNRFFRHSIEKLKISIADLNKRSLDFIVNLGDMIDKDWESFDEILPSFSQFKAPVFHVLGNHDYEVADDKKAQMHLRIGTEKYYDFSMKGWRFVVLNGNEISTFANLPGSAEFIEAERLLHKGEEQGKINANFWNGGIGKVQMEWLDARLKLAAQSKESTIVFCHYPLYPPDRHNLLNQEDVLMLLKNYKGVKMWINGHNHDGNYGLFGDIHFLNVKGMVEGEHDLAWSVVHIYKNTIEIAGFGNEVSARFSV